MSITTSNNINCRLLRRASHNVSGCSIYSHLKTTTTKCRRLRPPSVGLLNAEKVAHTETSIGANKVSKTLTVVWNVHIGHVVRMSILGYRG